MKYIVLVPDGAADYPVKELGDLTPLQAADTPNLDRLASRGRLGLVKTIPEGLAPGSDVANLCLLGYDPRRYYTGRGPLEAASMGIELTADETAFRCNLVTADGDILKDYSAGHITTPEAEELVKAVDAALGSVGVRFYPGVSYRHLMILKNIDAPADCWPPHDITGQSIKAHQPRGEGAGLLIDLMDRSRKVLSDHPLNRSRRAEGRPEANMIWLWGQGRKPTLPTFKEQFKLEGSIISAVDLIKGIGKYAGLEIIEVPGATGYFDTDYRGKAEHALRAMEQKDFVFVHVEAPDEAGHIGDVRAKIKALEDFDRLVAGVILEGMKELGPHRILVVPDHLTPVSVKTHVGDAVPYLIYDTEEPVSGQPGFNELAAKASRSYLAKGWQLMQMFLHRDPGI